MIDHAKEHMLTMAEAAKSLPKRPNKKKVPPNTIVRWSQQGLSGVFLETIRIGGTRMTSREALQRFFEALTEKADGAPQRRVGSSESYQASMRELEAMGV